MTGGGGCFILRNFNSVLTSMIAKIIREALRTSVSIAILAPTLALAALPDQARSHTQPPRLSALTVIGGAMQEEMVARLIVKPR